MADTGNTATISFGTSGFTANVHVIGGMDFTRPSIPTSHLGTTNFESVIPGDLIELGEFENEFEFDPDEQPPISAVAETITITFPVPTGMSNGATLAGSGFLTKWTTPEVRNNTLMVARYTVKFDGLTEPAWTDAT